MSRTNCEFNVFVRSSRTRLLISTAGGATTHGVNLAVQILRANSFAIAFFLEMVCLLDLRSNITGLLSWGGGGKGVLK